MSSLKCWRTMPLGHQVCEVHYNDYNVAFFPWSEETNKYQTFHIVIWKECTHVSLHTHRDAAAANVAWAIRVRVTDMNDRNRRTQHTVWHFILLTETYNSRKATYWRETWKTGSPSKAGMKKAVSKPWPVSGEGWVQAPHDHLTSRSRLTFLTTVLPAHGADSTACVGRKDHTLRKDRERRGLVGRQRQARQSCERQL